MLHRVGYPVPHLAHSLNALAQVLFRCIFVQNGSWTSSSYPLGNVLASFSVSGPGFLYCLSGHPFNGARGVERFWGNGLRWASAANMAPSLVFIPVDT